jgi:hypothetical protein
MKLKSLSCIALAAVSFFSVTIRAEEPGKGKTVRVLTVGNSFSQNATHYLGDIAKAAGDTLILHGDNVGGSRMELHWGKVQSFEKDPTDKNGLYSGGKSLRDDLKGAHWDVVTFQQASIKSHDIATYRPFAKQLSDYIRQHAPDATLLLHETWEYRVDDPRFAVKEPKAGEPKTQDEMYAGLSNAYATIAKELGVRRIPVGDAFHLANRDAKWGYRAPAMPFDAKNAKAGEVPEQLHSLNVGWKWTKQKDGTVKLAMDGHHANTAGEFLGACVWYEVIFGKSVEANPFVPPGLDPEYAKFLRATAHRAVEQGK